MENRTVSERVTLHGYRYSVYNRVARMALEEKSVAYNTVEVNPFVELIADEYKKLHPFGRVPALTHGSFALYETSAITRYVDAAFDGPLLTPHLPKSVAQMAQAIAIVDSYGYRPMVRQVFAHRIFRPLEGLAPSEDEIAAGLTGAEQALSALEAIANEGCVLTGDAISLADCHLAPMMAFFAATEEGAAMLRQFPALSDWWARIVGRSSMIRTDPGYPNQATTD